MARYTLDEPQRAIVEAALRLYEEGITKAIKAAEKIGASTRDLEWRLLLLNGDDEDPGLFRIFAKDLPEQRDAFHDRSELDDEAATEAVLEGVEEEAARREAQAEAVEDQPETEPESEDTPVLTLVSDEVEDQPDEEIVDGITDDSEITPEEVEQEVQAQPAPRREGEEIVAALASVLPWSKLEALDDPEDVDELQTCLIDHFTATTAPMGEQELAPDLPTPPAGGWYHTTAPGSLVQCLIVPSLSGVRYYYGTFDQRQTPTLQSAGLYGLVLRMLEERRPKESSGDLFDDLGDDPFADTYEEQAGKPEPTTETPEMEVGDEARYTADLRRKFKVATFTDTHMAVEDLQGKLAGWAPLDKVSWDDERECWTYAGDAWLEEVAGEKRRPLADRPTVRELELEHAENAKRRTEQTVTPSPTPEPATEPKATEPDPFDLDEGEDGVPAHLRDKPIVERSCLECFEDYNEQGVCPGCGDAAPWATAVTSGA